MLRRRSWLLGLLALIVAGVGAAVALAQSGGGTEVQVAVRDRSDGRLEFAIQTADGERHFPSARFLSDNREQDRWYTSSAVTLPGAAPAASTPSGEIDFATGRESGTAYICVVSHGDINDTFWSTVQRAVIAWQSVNRGYWVEYYISNDSAEQAQLIDDCVANGADGMLATIPDPDVIGPALLRATDAGVELVTFNSGSEIFKEVRSVLHVSIDEYSSGVEAGERLEAAGTVGTVVCVIHESANSALHERCDGLDEGYGGTVEVLDVGATGTQDPVGTGTALAQRVAQGGVGAVMALNIDIANIAYETRAAIGSDFKLASYGSTTAMIVRTAAGELEFLIWTLGGDQVYFALSALVPRINIVQGHLDFSTLDPEARRLALDEAGSGMLLEPSFLDQERAAAFVTYIEWLNAETERLTGGQ